ncbi:hypothetical protein BDD12DRAFT_867840 [Trichophaea hybrida]|nr:hypothetical protein BDD12DRAFT_867840 [Trichophaea hybrida]
MGFFGLEPADKLAASYEKATQTLTLYAEGTVPNFTSGITFNRAPWMGGLKFTLDGWTGPRGEGSRPYVHDQSFKFDLPSHAFPSGTVTIVTANHPNGKIVQIDWLEQLQQSLSDDQPKPSPPSNKQLTPDLNPQPLSPGNTEQHIISDPTHITALFKLPFEIQASDEVPRHGEVDIIFDPQYLVMTTAGIKDKDIVWTFNSLQTGNTQVIVITTGGIATFIKREVYDINIVVLEPKSSGPQGGAILSFLGRVNIADRIVTKQYPDAKLNVVEATLPVGASATTNPLHLSQLRAIFLTGNNGTVIIKSTGWGSWGPPEFIKEPLIGSGVVPWPVKMDIVVAVQVMQKAGYTGNFLSCSLRHPLGPSGKPFDEPYYIFQMEDGPAVFVGVNDSSIYVNKAGQAVLPEKNAA